MAEKKTTKQVAKKAAAPRVQAKTVRAEGGLTVALYDSTGEEKGKVALPKELFGEKVNKILLAQAVRVYLNNQRQGTVSTLTRGEVGLTKAKWYRQKGTGRARHGAQSAPIFVGGGVAHGPKPRNYELSFSKKMRKAALISALSAKAADAEIRVIEGLDKIEPKTKGFALALKAMGLYGAKTTVVISGKVENLVKAARNIENLEVKGVERLNTYDVLNGGILVLMQEAIEAMQKLSKENK